MLGQSGRELIDFELVSRTLVESYLEVRQGDRVVLYGNEYYSDLFDVIGQACHQRGAYPIERRFTDAELTDAVLSCNAEEAARMGVPSIEGPDVVHCLDRKSTRLNSSHLV